MRREIVLALLVIVALFLAKAALCAWSTDPAVNTPVSSFPLSFWYARVISDDLGGAIVAWEDNRRGNHDIYVQRLDLLGNALWTANGVPVCTASNNQWTPEIIPDGSGGAIISWTDYRNDVNYGEGDIYAQRVDSSGNALWAANGAPVCTATGHQFSPQLLSDGSGGAFITWESDSGIYVQRLDSSGNALWTVNGVPVIPSISGGRFPYLISDSSGGIVITWEDGGIVQGDQDDDIYAQRLDSSGNALWTTNGVPVCTATDQQNWPQLISDGSGGAIITWYDSRNGWDNRDIYVQRIDSSGNALWTTNGVAVCMATADQQYPQLISDGSGGTIITWEDWRGSIYAQRLDSSGNPQWAVDGVPICTAIGGPRWPQIIADGSGGAIITWEDCRDCDEGYHPDIYVQRVDSSGSALWTNSGVTICTAPDQQWFPQIVSDGSSGAIITWNDYRSGRSVDIYAQRISKDGLLGGEMKELIVSWFNDVGAYASFITVHNPSPETVTVSVTYTGPDGQDATPAVNSFTIGPNSSKIGRPHQASGPG